MQRESEGGRTGGRGELYGSEVRERGTGEEWRERQGRGGSEGEEEWECHVSLARSFLPSASRPTRRSPTTPAAYTRAIARAVEAMEAVGLVF